MKNLNQYEQWLVFPNTQSAMKLYIQGEDEAVVKRIAQSYYHEPITDPKYNCVWLSNCYELEQYDQRGYIVVSGNRQLNNSNSFVRFKTYAERIADLMVILDGEQTDK